MVSIFGKKEKKVDFLREHQMQEYGLHIHTGRQLEMRLEAIKELTKTVHRNLVGATPREKVEDLIKKIREVDTLIRQIGIAWISAGSDQRYRRAVDGYERLLQYALRDCLYMLDDLKGKDPIEQEGIALRLEIWIGNRYFRNALFLKDNSFFDKHVTPTVDKTMVVQAQPPGFGGGFGGSVTPTSGGRTTEETELPTQRPYPRQMSSGVKSRRRKEEDDE